MQRKSGISLIVLIITIVVIIILTGAIVINISSNNPISAATESVFKSDMKNIQDEIQLYMLSNIQPDGKYIYPTKEQIKSASKYDIDTLDIAKGKIVYKNPSQDKKNWLDKLEINSDYNQGLVLDVPLGNYQQTGIMKDKTLYNNSGVNHGTTLIANRFGELDKASNFSGSANVSIANSISFDFDSFTISMWVCYRDYTYPKTFGAIKKSLPNGYSAGGKGWDFGHGYHSDGVDVTINDGSTVIRRTLVFNSGVKPPDLLNKWTHIVYVVNRDTDIVSAYINGGKQADEINIGTVTGSITNTDVITLGGLYGWQTDGAIDDLRIYNRALSPDEIKSIYGLNYED